MRERDYLWDNIKALLIFFVVAGHVLEMSTLNYKLAHVFDVFIYSFHMPAFIFVSGFFAKRYCSDGKVKAVKAATLFAYYAVFQLLFMLLRIIFHIGSSNQSFFNPNRGLWYLLAMFFFYLITPIVEKLPAWITLPVTIALALAVANDRQANTYMSIMRIFTFMPYFFAGYYFKAESLSKMRSLKAGARYPLAALCTIASVAIWALMWVFNKDIPLRALMYGKDNNLHPDIALEFGEATVYRLILYVVAALMIVALLLAVPSKKSIIAKAGQNSLQIFVFHMILVIALFDTNIVTLRIDSLPVFLLSMAASLAVTAVLSLWFFGYPFKWIQTGVKKLYSIKK